MQGKIRVDLIRHGKTEANEKRLYCGFSDSPLSEAGIAQLTAIKPGLKLKKADILVHSGMLRTIETMKLLAESESGIELTELKEMNFGDFEGKDYELLKEDPRYIQWIMEECPSPPNGESRQDFLTRILKGFDILKNMCPKSGSICAFTHGGVIATLLEALRPGEKNFYEWQPGFGMGYSLYIEDGEIKKIEKIEA